MATARGTTGRDSRSPRSNSHVLKVILLGDGGVGKSSLMNVFVHRKFDEKSFHTIGVEFLIKDITIEGETFTLQIWDTAGQERFKSLRTPFYRGADCCLLTFALNDRESFLNLAHWKQEFIHYADIGSNEKFPFVVLGNKCDLAKDVRPGGEGGEEGMGREVGEEEARAWCEENGGMPYYETSARDTVNVDVAFEAVARQVKELDKESNEAVGRIGSDTIQLSYNRRRVKANQRGAAESTCC